MAHGVIPPFCGMLVSEAFVSELSKFETPDANLVLLGNASNAVEVSQEVAEAYFELIKASYCRYLASGACDLRDGCGRFSSDAQLVLVLLLGSVLDIDPATECLHLLMPSLHEKSQNAWRVLVNGALRSKIQAVEEELGMLVKEGAKDVYTHAPEEGGYERLEWALMA